MTGGEKRMKKGFWHKAVVMILAGMLAVLSVTPVSAASLLDEVKPLETEADFAEDTSYVLLRGNNLSFGNAKITKLASNKVNIFGLTQGIRNCDTMYLSLYLERKVNGVYSTYKSWDFTVNNDTSLAQSINVIVPSGYYYRVRGYHAAKEGGVKESTTTLTNGILVK